MIDHALDILDGCGPEFASGLSNHGPMGAEALCALGREDAVEQWVAKYRKRLLPRPSNVDRIDATNWAAALGDVQRVSDWEDFLAADTEDLTWQEALERWVPRLAPGLMSGATHGIIRTAHATRTLSSGETPARRAELIAGLAYWAARYQVVPGVPIEVAPRRPSEALADLPIMPLHMRAKRPTSIFGAVAELDAFPPFAEAINLAAPGNDVPSFLTDLTETMATLYLRNAGPASIPYVHTVTAPAALRIIAPFVSLETAKLTARYTWQACAAIHSRGDYPKPVERLETLPTRDDLVERAVFSGDEHAIKFAEACLREYALNPNPVYLAATLDMSGRYGRRQASG